MAKIEALVLDSVSSPITRRVYNMALDEFIGWYRLEPRPASVKRQSAPGGYHLRPAASVPRRSIIRMSAIRKLAVEAADNGLGEPLKTAKAKGLCVAKTGSVQWPAASSPVLRLLSRSFAITSDLKQRSVDSDGAKLAESKVYHFGKKNAGPCRAAIRVLRKLGTWDLK